MDLFILTIRMFAIQVVFHLTLLHLSFASGNLEQPNQSKKNYPNSAQGHCQYYYAQAAEHFDDISRIETNLLYADSAMALAEKHDLTLYRIKTHILIGRLYTHKLTLYEGWSPSHVLQPKHHFDEAMKLAKQLNDIQLISETYSSMIYYYFRSNDFDIAASLAQKHIQLLETYGLLDETPYALMGLIYGKQGQTATAMGYFTKNIDVLVKMGEEDMISGVMSDIGNMFFAMGEYDSARHYYLQGLAVAEEFNDDRGLSFLKDNIGLTFLNQSDYKSSIEWLMAALEHRKAAEWLEGTIVTMHHLGEAYLDHGLPDAAKTILLEAFHLTGNNSQLYNSELTSDLLARAFEALGQYDSAYYFIKIAHHYQSEMWQKETERSIRASINSLELEKDKLKNKLEVAGYKNVIISALAILLLVAIVAGIFIFKSRKEKMMRVLAVAELKTEEEKLSRLELEKARHIETSKLKERELQNNISSLNRELLGYSHIVAIKNDALNQVLTTIKQLVQANNGTLTSHDVSRLNSSIKDKIDNENDWIQFLNNFNSINPNFFNALKTSHPQLTTNDLRLCVYMFMSLSSAEIAQVMNISMDSLRNARLRLRQKMGLAGDVELDQYIRSLVENQEVA